MNIPKLLFSFFISTLLLPGQNSVSDDFGSENKSITVFTLESGVGFSMFTGEGHFAQAYAESPFGWHVMSQMSLDGTWLFGFLYDDNMLEVTNTELVGAYDKSRIFHYQLVAGYRWLDTDRFSIETSLGAGSTRVRNAFDGYDERYNNFIDKGWGIGGYGRVTWAFSKYLGLYAGLNMNWDKFSTKVPPELEDLFNDSFRVMPLIGLRFLGKRSSP